MSLHLDAKSGDIAETVLLPGDPLRAKFIAEKYLKDPVRYNERRAAYGFTGTYNGQRVSVQATGMGIPSLSIYVHEMIAEYGVKTLVRIGTCGAIQADLALGDVIAAVASSHNSAINQGAFGSMTFAPAADFGLLLGAHQQAQSAGVPVRFGTVLSVDLFYDRPGWWEVWAAHGVLATEMETAGLYTLAAQHKVRAMSLLTVSDQIVSGGTMPPADRERSLDRMITLALGTVTRK